MLVHLADIHIGHPGREAEYAAVFEAAAAAIPPGAIVLIAGDIFDHKVRYSGSDVDLFNKLMRLLAAHDVVIIPGNHDANLNDPENMDLLTPVIDIPNVRYWKQSGKYEIGGHKFYHVSVFGDETTTEILEALQPDEILLYHGMVDGAIFGKHVASGQRITREIMDKARAVMLGDIHQQQFVRPKAAYCGSLIQQNVAESPNKGFLLWDLGNLTANFVQIPNAKGFIRLDLRGMTAEQARGLLADTTAPAELLKLSVFADDTTSDEILESIKDKFGRLDVINTTNKAAQIESKDSIGETLRELLVSRGLTTEQAAECVADYTAGAAAITQRKWTVKSMQWDGLFKYGTGNAIDFTALEGGISGVIAPNRAGKSSIIDILIFGLFGELLRSDRNGMINDGCDRSRVRVDFSVDDRLYYIERRDDKRKHTVLRLYRQVEGGYENITAESTTKTYAAVSSLIGTSSQLLATGIYYDWANDITRVSPAERARLLSDLFGLSDTERIVNTVKAKIRTVEQAISALVKPRISEPSAPAAEGRLTALRQERSTISADLRTVSARAAELASELAGIRNPASIRAELAAMPVVKPVCAAKPAPCATCNGEDRQLAVGAPNMADAVSRLAVLQSKVIQCEPPADIRAEIDKLRLVPKPLEPILPTSTRPTMNDLAEISAKLHDFAPIPSNEAVVNLLRKTLDTQRKRSAAMSAEVAALEAKLGPEPLVHVSESVAELKLAISRIITTPIADTYELRSQVLTLRSNTQLQFDDGCASCKSNKSVLVAQLAILEGKLEATEAANVARAAANDAAQREKAELGRRLEAASRMALAGEIEVARAKIEDPSGTIAELADAEAKLAEINAENLRRADAGRELADQKRQIEKTVAEWDKYDRAVESYKVRASEYLKTAAGIAGLQSKLAIASAQADLTREIKAARLGLRRAEAAAKCAAADAYSQYVEWNEYTKYVGRREVLERELTIAEASASKLTEAGELTGRIRAKTEAISELDVKIGKVGAEVAVARAEDVILADYAAAYPPLAAELQRLKRYKDCLGVGGLRVQVIKKYIARVIDGVNAILARVSTFSIACEVSDSEAEFLITESGARRPLRAGSGFQRFIVAMAVRIALVSVLPASSTFIMIDEGFGCMDKHNLGLVVDFMAGGHLTSQSFVFVISHIDEIASAITMPLYIKARGGSSSLSNSALVGDEPVEAEPVEQTILCDCGATIKRIGLARHLKTARHLRKVEVK